MSTNPYSLPPETEPWWLPEENQQQQQQEAYINPMEPIRVQPIRIWRPDQPEPQLQPQPFFHDDNNNHHYHRVYQQQQQQQQEQCAAAAAAVVGDNMKELMFEKALTPSDVGKLNRLVIPKSKAEAHLPAGADGYSPTHGKGLILDLEDENGKWWNFRYSYWHSSQSYVLTKGWTRYVKEKQLEAGDVVMFQKHRFQPNRFFVSWRRRLPDDIPPARPRRNQPDGDAGNESGSGGAADDENVNDIGNEDENNNNNSSGYSHENSESTTAGVGRVVREFFPEFIPYPTEQDQHLSYNPDFLPHAGEGSEAPNETTPVGNGTGSASGSGGCWVFGVNFG